MTTRPIQSFVRALARQQAPPLAHNQYANGPGAEVRRANLGIYLATMQSVAPRLLLVGEAPSHRGCRLTGIPFMSERLMLEGIESAGMFGAARGFRKSTGRSEPSTEASATIVWETIGSVRPVPLLWNAFPFHPHRGGDQRSNRTPSIGELEMGQPFLVTLIELFAIRKVVAVGNRAHDSLTRLGIEHARVRHPSHGGKAQFAAGIRQLCHNQDQLMPFHDGKTARR